jgi:Trk K+ transport system NAD-binding subunit
MTQETLVLGGGPIGLELAAELAAADQPTAVVDSEQMVRRARAAGLSGHESSLETGMPAVTSAASAVVVATPCDARNLRLAVSASTVIDADRVVALVNDPDRRAAFEDAGIETVCVSRAVARATTAAIGDPERPAEVTADAPSVEDATTDARPAEDARAVQTDERVRLDG